MRVSNTHPTKELIDMIPKYQNTVSLDILHSKDSEDNVHEVEQTILLRNAHFIPDNSCLVLRDILRMH